MSKARRSAKQKARVPLLTLTVNRAALPLTWGRRMYVGEMLGAIAAEYAKGWHASTTKLVILL